ncbi:helix-turn-helix transcriptional regulator [Larkinella terrae]|uniref:Helix-turn-helix domain-containing protein n=1 Tax=Larkinella terrae TaxID=2025311 RepID=A0A7K0ELT7_9BACT|nr:helix-turn-helix transcriptional regulator [Larkinella terrae]MRS62754.1 helix-turn-helix domain-containing protein [Larkinella terrae]
MYPQSTPFNSLKTILNSALNGNRDHVEAVCQRMGINPTEVFDYVCQAMEYGAGYRQTQPVAEQARAIVLRRLDHQQTAQIEDVADELGLSVRSLQRRLQAEDVNFREIIDYARRDIALRLIRTTQHNINEIACVMGYDEPSSFRRAFKKWTGHNPKAYQLSAC